MKELIPIIRSVICHSPTQDSAFSDDQVRRILSLSGEHDVTPIVAEYFISRGDISQAAVKDCQKAKYAAIYRFLNQKQLAEKAFGVLTEVGIPFLPLKGSVIRQYYPQPWMRTSVDVDLLLPEDAVFKAASLLENRLHLKRVSIGSHDISLAQSGKATIELHYRLMENGRIKTASAVLDEVWSHAFGKTCQKQMDDPMLYCYHIAHMAKHIENGGCGIRPFIDLWLLNHSVPADSRGRKLLLERAGLDVFERKAAALAEKWFSGAAGDSQELLEAFVLSHSAFGDSRTAISVRKQKSDGNIPYIFSRLFIPYEDLKIQYPAVRRFRILTPVFEAARWFRIFKPDSRRHLKSELKAMRQDVPSDTFSLLRELDLL